jgi:hypothetical protein
MRNTRNSATNRLARAEEYQMSSRWPLALAVLLGAALDASAATAESKSRAPASLYAKKATWAETMVAARTACADLLQDAAEGQLAATPLPALWARIQADWPAPAARFRQDLSGVRYLDWFLQPGNTGVERWIIGRALGRIAGVDAGLGRQFADLTRDHVPADDPRWLDLYARACRFEDLATSGRRIWLGDLRGDFERQAAELVRSNAAADHTRWTTLQRWAERCAGSGKAAHPGQMAELRPAAELLAAALPGRFSAAADWTQRLAGSEPRWRRRLAAIARHDPEALAALPSLLEEIGAARRALLRSLAGMEEFLAPAPGVDLELEWEEQFAALADDLANRAWFDQVAPQTLRPEALILPRDRDPLDVVLRRTAALLADLTRRGGAAGLADADPRLAALVKAAAAIQPAQREARYVLYAEACRLRRQIAFRNPLLDFRELLFVKRHRALYPHMCDQYYGIAARPGGGLYVLSDPFGPSPRLRDVLAGSVVLNGRLQGQKLSGGPNRPWHIQYDGMGHLSGEPTEGGSFLSPDLSYDGTRILFAYVECTGDREHVHHTDPARGHWAPGRCYHVFQVNVDGSHLLQRTDGTWNDFDPRWLPSGRIAFISERRGGYLRCGRVCPTYTLHDMAADGRGIRCLSPHETNEWHPSVTHDGRIAWTRWDYVDRHFSAAHMPWFTSVDGCDPRPIHGNYAWRGSRPDMELNLRAIPGSPKYEATAAPHHGQAFGSLVIIDPRVPDDDGGSPLRRLTPAAGFPETADDGRETFGSAWPLSEDYHLCVYDAGTRRSGPHASRPSYADANYGIYLVDAFGNLELVYRDAQISCHQPIPLTPRPKPPVLSESSQRLAGPRPPEATVAVLNVYDSLKPWPAGTQIRGLRVWQIIPLSVAPAVRNNGIQVPRTGSVNTGRALLGTVPVESDGSAQLLVPAGKEMFFQALDANGLALQSMRSGTHFQPGETRLCQGCHEPKHRAPRPVQQELAAMRRPPSRLQPDVDGTNPFSYARLVQPVLNQYCVECHAKNHDKAVRLDAEPVRVAGKAYMDLPTTYYASYANLAPQFGFYDYGGADGRSHRTTPGQFGARASKLYAVLIGGHYDLKLPPADLHRIAVWLDSCSMFYGVYEKEGGEAQLRGEVVHPTLE